MKKREECALKSTRRENTRQRNQKRPDRRKERESERERERETAQKERTLRWLAAGRLPNPPSNLPSAPSNLFKTKKKYTRPPPLPGKRMRRNGTVTPSYRLCVFISLRFFLFSSVRSSRFRRWARYRRINRCTHVGCDVTKPFGNLGRRVFLIRSSGFA